MIHLAIKFIWNLIHISISEKLIHFCAFFDLEAVERDVLREHAAEEPRSIAVLIGPEGGFSDDEVEAVTAAGGRSVTLGKTTLRTETAGMAAIAMIMYELEL